MALKVLMNRRLLSSVSSMRHWEFMPFSAIRNIPMKTVPVSFATKKDHRKLRAKPKPTFLRNSAIPVLTINGKTINILGIGRSRKGKGTTSTAALTALSFTLHAPCPERIPLGPSAPWSFLQTQQHQHRSTSILASPHTFSYPIPPKSSRKPLIKGSISSLPATTMVGKSSSLNIFEK